MSLHEEPARKLFICQCLQTILDDSSKSIEHKKWTLIGRNKVFPLRLIWVQGIIFNVSVSLRTFSLDDGTGIANIVSVNEAPGFGPWIKNGLYCMVIGELLSIKPTITVKAVKITKLGNSNEETLWNLEVIDFWKNMDNS